MDTQGTNPHTKTIRVPSGHETADNTSTGWSSTDWPCARSTPPAIVTGKHFDWLVEHGLALCQEYTARYGKVHACQQVIEAVRLQRSCIEDNGWSTQPQCMPDQYKTDDVVQAYRAFYLSDKRAFATWRRNQPAWWR